jgi:hypothetical protein
MKKTLKGGRVYDLIYCCSVDSATNSYKIGMLSASLAISLEISG